MSDYRFEIVDHNGIRSLHVMIDAEPMAETHIPLSNFVDLVVEDVINRTRKQIAHYSTSPLTGEIYRESIDEPRKQWRVVPITEGELLCTLCTEEDEK